jgi:hypothetical protein
VTFARSASALSLLAVAAMAIQCGDKKGDDFYAKVYACNAKAPDPDCGTTRSGAPLMCTRVLETLGGSDICAEQCLEGPEVVTADYACLQDRSKVARCRPSAGLNACSDSALRCLRTDLEQDEGVCLPINTCTTDSDCTGTQPACASTLAASQYPAAAQTLKLDSLNCMAVGCNANKTGCLPGQQCIQAVFGPMPGVPDVCLPTCDSTQWRCPPNHSCLKRLSPAYPDICVPGLLGKPCDTDLDCMIGSCLDVGYDYKVCSRPCNADADCIPFDNGQTYFFCANNWCVSPESLLWPDCATDADCPGSGLVCARPNLDDQYGACRIPCADDGSCPSRAGIIHGCHVWSGQSVCQPGLFARYDCTADADCAPGLHCLPFDSGDPPRQLCSITCQTDDDCSANRQTTLAYCGAGVCRQPEAEGRPCDRARVCESGRCDTTTKTCAGSS